MRFCLALVLAIAGCQTYSTDTAGEEPEFCSDVSFGGQSWVEDVSDASAGSGTLSIKVITDQSDDPSDPYYVAYRSYALEPTETGGVQTIGTTSGDGLVEKTLGAGLWDFEATWTRGSTTCVAVAEALAVEEVKTTHACVVLTCPLD